MAGRQPDYVIACVGGGSNAMGIFYDYIPHERVKLVGVEAAGEGLTTMRHAASLPARLAGRAAWQTAPTCCRTENGQITETTPISAGLDYPGVGPEHAWLKDSGRAEYVGATDAEALAAFHDCCRIGGHHPGAGVEPCAGLCGEAGADAAGRDRPAAGQPLRRGDKDCPHRRRGERPGVLLPGVVP